MVPRVGLEPTQGCPYQILSLARLPVSPPRRCSFLKNINRTKCESLQRESANLQKRFTKMVRLARLELARVASPPPQDGVSTIPPQPRQKFKNRLDSQQSCEPSDSITQKLQQWIRIKHDDCDN